MATLKQGKVCKSKSMFGEKEEDFELDSFDFDLSIIGIRNLWDEGVGWGRRFVWALCLGSCILIVAYYVSSRVAWMLSRPTQVAVTLKQNSSLQLPDVTLCPMLEEGNSLWTSSINFISGSSVNYANTMGKWETTQTTLGSCLTHGYDEAVQASGLSFGMSMRVNWSLLPSASGLRLLFHSRRDVPLPGVEGINVPPGQDLSIAIRLKAFSSLNREGHPCIKDSNYARSHCVNSCFNKELKAIIKCRLPFMNEAGGDSELNKTCGGGSGVGTVGIPWRESSLRLWSLCSTQCGMECSKLILSPYIESVGVAFKGAISQYTIYFPEMWYEIVEEKESYDLIAFLCDIGGTFGLFLGCSLLSLVQLLEMLALYINIKIRSKSR